MLTTSETNDYSRASAISINFWDGIPHVPLRMNGEFSLGIDRENVHCSCLHLKEKEKKRDALLFLESIVGKINRQYGIYLEYHLISYR